MSMDITPPHLRCGMGSCPSVHILGDGNLLVIGKDILKDPKLLGRFIPAPAGVDVGDDERAVLISSEYFSALPEINQLREDIARYVERDTKRVAELDAQTRITEACQSSMREMLARIEALEARLEIDHHFELIEGEMTRVEVPAEDREIGSLDGISCRDATIELQDEHIVKLKAQVASLREALGCQAEVTAVGERSSNTACSLQTDVSAEAIRHLKLIRDDVFHEEQLQIWSDEFLADISPYVNVETYDDGVVLHESVKAFLTSRVLERIGEALLPAPRPDEERASALTSSPT